MRAVATPPVPMDDVVESCGAGPKFAPPRLGDGGVCCGQACSTEATRAGAAAPSETEGPVPEPPLVAATAAAGKLEELPPTVPPPLERPATTCIRAAPACGSPRLLGAAAAAAEEAPEAAKLLALPLEARPEAPREACVNGGGCEGRCCRGGERLALCWGDRWSCEGAESRGVGSGAPRPHRAAPPEAAAARQAEGVGGGGRPLALVAPSTDGGVNFMRRGAAGPGLNVLV